MIRVVYRWNVDPQRAEDFTRAWWEATGHIQAAWPGARGSVLLRSQLEPDVHLAVARWDSLEAWEASRAGNSVVPASVVERMRTAARAPATYEIFDEILDWSLSVEDGQSA